MKTLLCSAAFIAASTVAATAQLTVDRSIVLTGTERLYELDRQRDRVTPLTTASTTTEYSAVCMDRTNLNAVIVDRVGKRILFYSDRGRIATFKTLSASTHIRDIALDEDGHYVMCDPFARTILRTSGSSYNGPITTVATLAVPPQALCIDDDTGDTVVAVYRLRPAASALLRVNRRTASVSTIASGFGQLTGVDHDQTTGNFVLTTRSAPNVRVVTPDGRTVLSKAFTGANAVRVDDETGTIWVASNTQVMRISADFRNTKLFPAISNDVIHGIELWGRQKLAGNPAEEPIRGADFEIQGRFPASGDKAYVCALGLGDLRPGFRVAGNRTINIQVDPLFFATVNGNLPVYTTDFTGTTSSAGGFSARFLVPPVGVGTRFVFVAAALNSAMPGNLDVASSYVFHVR